jgi:hypothetical protein
MDAILFALVVVSGYFLVVGIVLSFLGGSR